MTGKDSCLWSPCVRKCHPTTHTCPPLDNESYDQLTYVFRFLPHQGTKTPTIVIHSLPQSDN